MLQSSKKRVIAIALVACLAVGAAGFFAGEYVQTVHYQKEQAAEILLNRGELEGLGEIEGPIYVTGHKSPDSDTVCSSMAYASLLRGLGYDAIPVILGNINSETKLILQAAGAQTPEQLEDASGQTMVLVDHSEYIQSAEGLENARIIGVIDHHGVGTVRTGNPLVYDARPVGSTSTVIWMRYRYYGVDVDKQTALLMMGAILSDTLNLKSAITTSMDKEAVKALSRLADISDTDAFYQEMYRASLSFEGMTDEEIFFSDYKEYEVNGRRFSICCMPAYDEAGAKDLAERMKAVAPQARVSTGIELSFALISVFHDDLDLSFVVPGDDAAGDVLEAAFDQAAPFDGTSYRFEPGLVRKKDLVPAITGVLEDYPKE